jgi:2-(1,2-epoxy-1,2-dihydrophenyl)acetyl-CoA isomerase
MIENKTSPDPMREVICRRHENDIVQIVINRPKARNALSFGVWEELAAALDAIERDTPPRALILCGAENYFSAGGDIKTPPARGDGALHRAARVELAQRVIQRVHAFPAPTIAAIEGGAIGLAWSLALACDMVIAAENVQFRAPFANMGIVPDGGLLWFLTRQLGRYRASEIVFSGRVVDAAQAHAAGLTTRLVEPGRTIEVALEMAATLGAGNRKAVELIKRLLHRAETDDLSSVNAIELAYCQITQSGEEITRSKRGRDG